MQKPFHPFLIAIYPLMAYFCYNINQVSFHLLPAPLIILVAATALLFLLLNRFSRDYRKNALVLSVFVLSFFSYGYVFEALNFVQISGHKIFRHPILIPLVSLTFVLVAFFVYRSKRDFAPATRAFNGIAIILMLLPIIVNWNGLLHRLTSAEKVVQEQTPPNPKIVSAEHPDIYFIVLDKYTNAQVLAKYFQSDNSEFIKYLKKTNFIVADEAYANYPYTILSLPSTLNMDYLPNLMNVQEEKGNDYEPLGRLLLKNRVVGELKAAGYKYVHIGNRWGYTANDPRADFNFNYFQQVEFYGKFMEKTMYQPFYNLFVNKSMSDIGREALEYQFNKLEESITIPGPKIIFVHFPLPHDPYLYDKNGFPLKMANDVFPDSIYKYTGYLKYGNKRIKAILKKILAQTGIKPVIILQGDEGPFYPDWPAFSKKKFSEQDIDVLRVKSAILNAVYIQGKHLDTPPGQIAPVNVFRTVFNKCFKTDYPVGEDRCFVPYSFEKLYQFVDITDKLHAPQNNPAASVRQ